MRRELMTRAVETGSVERRQTVAALIAEVRREGDLALLKLTERFDGVRLRSIAVTSAEMSPTVESPDLKKAYENIWRFHEPQLPMPYSLVISPGVVCERVFRPIQRVGLYIPGGSAPLPSTVLMLGVPARIAGCPEVIICTPPRKDGSIDPSILAAAKLCGISRIFKAGGAQAIAAMAYGTESVPKVDKVFGPGNAWVTEAKQQVAMDPAGAALDLPAGPSEVMVIADAKANPEFVAWDLLSQAEHGPDSHAVLLSTSDELITAVEQRIEEFLPLMPRAAIARVALTQASIMKVDSIQAAIAIANEYAPEHLILQVEEASEYRDQIINAGSVFLGRWTPESVGDYASGTNHVLPTYGYARAYGGLGVESFLKSVTFQSLTQEGLRFLGPVVENLAAIEGLDAHRQAVSVRLRGLR